jgi:tetratricopeptide (TPR) repeat protein
LKKQRHWLDLAEYASLVSLGVGSVASFVSEQALFASAPLSFLVLLNLANRRRFEQQMRLNTSMAIHDMDQKLSKNVELLNQQVMALPTPEVMGSLKKSLLVKNREVVERLSAEIEGIQREMIDRFSVLEQQNLGTFRQDLSQIQMQHSQLCDSVAYLTTQLNDMMASTRMDELEGAIARLRADAAKLRDNLQNLADQTRPSLNSLQDQINYLNRQLQKLPPPFDSTALKQEVAELIRVVADLVPKRDWNNLLSEVRTLQEQQETRNQAEETLRRKIQDLNQQIQGRPVKANLTSLQNQINHLNRQFQKLPPPFDPSSLKREVSELMKAVANLVPKRDWNALVAQIKALQQQQEFQKQFESTLNLELQDLSRQIQLLAVTPQQAVAETSEPEHVSVGPLPGADATQPQQEFQARIEDILQRELQALDQQLRTIPSSPQLQAQVEEMIYQELLDINQQLRAFPSKPHYELVFDFKSTAAQAQTGVSASRAVLEEALATTTERLILIWPWSSQCQLDDGLLQQLEAFLVRGGQLDLGWCHMAHRNEERFLSPINQRWSINPIQQGLQTTLQKLLQLKRTSPNRFQFKILGTGENFLVSDRSFVVLGIDEALTATTVFPDMELKLRTDDEDVIQQCIQRFEDPVLHSNDVTAYWNRAVTRYDLGDRQSALDDFNQVLNVNPTDAIAYNYRGLVLYDLGRQLEALADFSRSLELNPHQVCAYCNRGFVRSEQGDQLGAIADYSLALQNQPNSAIAYFYRGMACQKYNDPLAAVTDFSDAIRLVPDSPIAYYYRGQAYQKLENIQGAIADFGQAAQLFTQRGNKTNAQKALRSLTKLQQLQAQLPQSQPPQTTLPSLNPEPLVALFESSGFTAESNGTAAVPLIYPEPVAAADVSLNGQTISTEPVVETAEPVADKPAEADIDLTQQNPGVTSEPVAPPNAGTVSESAPPVQTHLIDNGFDREDDLTNADMNGAAYFISPEQETLHEEPTEAAAIAQADTEVLPPPSLLDVPPTAEETTSSESKSATPHPNEDESLTTVETLSKYFYSDASSASTNGTVFVARSAEPTTVFNPDISLPFGDRPDETLADFCKRF